MTFREALELAISELVIVTQEETSVTDNKELRKAIDKLKELLETRK